MDLGLLATVRDVIAAAKVDRLMRVGLLCTVARTLS